MHRPCSPERPGRITDEALAAADARARAAVSAGDWYEAVNRDPNGPGCTVRTARFDLRRVEVAG